MKKIFYLNFLFLTSFILCNHQYAYSQVTFLGDNSSGFEDGNVSTLTRKGDSMFFSGTQGVIGNMKSHLFLWDGSAITCLTKSLDLPAGSITSIVIMKNEAYFLQNNVLCKSDGTVSGTQTLATFQKAPVSGEIIELNGKLIFGANSLAYDDELWVSDGTANGTKLLKDINVDFGTTSNSNPGNFIRLGNKVVFNATTLQGGSELYITDGTTNGTQLLKDIRPGKLGSSPTDMFLFDSEVYFNADDGTNGTELWKTDGTASGTVLVKDINSGSGSSRASNFIEYKSDLYFTGTGGLYKTDGTSSGTVNVSSNAAESSLSGYYVFGGSLYFEKDNYLWKSDGTSSGTSGVVSLGTNAGKVYFMGELNSKMIWAHENLSTKMELWQSDGTSSGTSQIIDLNGGSPGVVASSIAAPNFIQIGSKVLFYGNNGFGATLMETNGTASGTKSAGVVNNATKLPSFFGNLSFMATAGNSIYFGLSNRTGELWKTNGTLSGTNKVINTDSVSEDILPSGLHTVGGYIMFKHAESLWVYDTANATAEILSSQKDQLSNTAFRGEFAAVVNNKFIFSSKQSLSGGTLTVSGYEPWVSDGTNSGTFRLKDIKSGGNSSDPKVFGSAGGYVYFSAEESVSTELWRTDGTTSGTAKVGTSLNPTSTTTYATLDSAFYYTTSTELVKTKGTNATTSSINSDGLAIVEAIDSLIYLTKFSGSSAVRGLYVSDGTSNGTKQIRNTRREVKPLGKLSNGKYYWVENRSLYESDGTPSSVKVVLVNVESESAIKFGDKIFIIQKPDVQLGIIGGFLIFDGNPANLLTVTGSELLYDFNRFKVINDKLFFRATSFDYGDELYVYESPTSPTFGFRHQEIGSSFGEYLITNLSDSILSGVLKVGAADMNETLQKNGFVISNSGTSDLIFTKKPVLSGPYSSNFTLVNFPDTVPALSNAEFSVQFTGSTTDGENLTNVQFHTNDPSTPIFNTFFYGDSKASPLYSTIENDLGLAEFGRVSYTSAKATVTENRVLPDAEIGKTVRDTFRLINVGYGLPLEIDSIKIIGRNASDFKVTFQNQQINSLNNFAVVDRNDSLLNSTSFSNIIVVEHTPTAAGVRYGQLEFYTNSSRDTLESWGLLTVPYQGFAKCDDVGNISPDGPLKICTNKGQSNVTLTLPAVANSTYCWGNVGWTPQAQVDNTSARSAKLIMDDNDVVYLSAMVSNKANVWKLDADSLIQIGSAGFANISNSTNAYIDYELAASPSDDSLFFAYRDNSNSRKASVQKFDGSSWNYLGAAGFSAGQAEELNIEISGQDSIFVAYIDVENFYRPTVKKFDGNNWKTVGKEGFTASQIEWLDFEIHNNTLYVAFKDRATASLGASVMKFSGGKWQYVGNAGFSGVESERIDLEFDANGVPYVLYLNADSYKPTVMKYISNSWSVVGAQDFSRSKLSSAHLAIVNGNPMVVLDVSLTGTTFMELKDGDWLDQISTVEETRYSTTSIVGKANGKAYAIHSVTSPSNEARIQILKLNESSSCLSTTNSLTVTKAGTYQIFVTNNTSNCTVGANNPVTVEVGDCFPELVVYGNNTKINNKDISTTSSDFTNWGRSFKNQSPSVTYSIVNEGTDTLILRDSVQLRNDDSASFYVSSQPNDTIYPGQSSEIKTTFTDSSYRTYKTKVYVYSNAGGEDSVYYFAIQNIHVGAQLTQTDSLVYDANNNGKADVGDTIRYEVIWSQDSAETATFLRPIIYSELNQGTELVVGSVVSDATEISEGNNSGDNQVIVRSTNNSSAGMVVTTTFNVVITSIPSGVSDIVNNSYASLLNTTVLSDDPDKSGNFNPTATPIGASISVTLTQESNINCNGASTGALRATVTGGRANFTYAWSNSVTNSSASDTFNIINNLSAGTYSVIVTDADGLKVTSADFVLAEPSSITTNLAQNMCFGDSIQLGGAYRLNAGVYNDTLRSATGCDSVVITTLSVNQRFSDTTVTRICSGDSALIGGQYRYASGFFTDSFATIAGCDSLKVQQLVFSSPIVPVIALDSNDRGNGGGATVSVSGGNSPYTYKWSNNATTTSISGATAGTYTITITDSLSCTSIDSIIISSGPDLKVTVLSNASCFGENDGVAKVNVFGAASYKVLWNTNDTTDQVNGLAAGNYWARIITDNQDTLIDSFIITQPAFFNAVINEGSSLNLCPGDSIKLTTNTLSGITYSWRKNTNGAPSVSGESIYVSTTGIYVLTANNSSNCSETDTIIISEPSTISITSYTDQKNACNGNSLASAWVKVCGGKAPYTYSWSNNTLNDTITGLSAGTYIVTVTDANSQSINDTVTITEPSAISPMHVIDSMASTLTSMDATFRVIPSGGTPDYSFNWSHTQVDTNQFVGVGQGTFRYTLTDANNCTYRDSVIIRDRYNVSIAVIRNASCNGSTDGAAIATIVGGNKPLSYQWLQGDTTKAIKGLVSGTYYFRVVDAQNDTLLDSVIITQPDKLSTTATLIDSVSCFGLSDGEAKATVLGGTMPYTYQWSNSETGVSANQLSAKGHKLVVTDANGCRDSATLTMLQPDSLHFAFTFIKNISCFGANDGELGYEIKGGTAPYFGASMGGFGSIAATDTVLNLSPLNNTLLAIYDANNCVDSIRYSILEPAKLVASVLIDTNAACFGDASGAASNLTTGGTLPYSYVWNTTATDSSITNLVAGNYEVIVTDGNGCKDTADNTVTQPALLLAGTIDGDT
ncbi:MAG: choice-of-anchor D domain-containing protein, partial [Bacteroidia bacterium]